ncbi:MAG: outer membrane protein transport protein [Comamonadaceae bacterium]|nr:outer membrane protein transport protein [Comamonadaceae bacterium]
MRRQGGYRSCRTCSSSALTQMLERPLADAGRRVLDRMEQHSQGGHRSHQHTGGTPTIGQAGSTAQTLDADFQDTWRVALGAIYKIDNAWNGLQVRHRLRPDAGAMPISRAGFAARQRPHLVLGRRAVEAEQDVAPRFRCRHICTCSDSDIDNNQIRLNPARAAVCVTGSYDA